LDVKVFELLGDGFDVGFDLVGLVMIEDTGRDDGGLFVLLSDVDEGVDDIHY
jgi:hypothetical protein